MKANKLLITYLLLNSLFLTSCPFCRPVVCEFYMPKAKGGTIKESRHEPGVMLKDVIEFDRDGLTLSIYAKEIPDGIKVYFDFFINTGTKVRFSKSLVKISIPSNKNVFEVSINTETKGIYRTIKYVIIRVPNSNMVKLKLPTLYINNKQWDLPEIAFKKVKKLELLIE